MNVFRRVQNGSSNTAGEKTAAQADQGRTQGRRFNAGARGRRADTLLSYLAGVRRVRIFTRQLRLPSCALGQQRQINLATAMSACPRSRQYGSRAGFSFAAHSWNEQLTLALASAPSGARICLKSLGGPLLFAAAVATPAALRARRTNTNARRGAGHSLGRSFEQVDLGLSARADRAEPGT
jgi:hypothetical protein